MLCTWHFIKQVGFMHLNYTLWVNHLLLKNRRRQVKWGGNRQGKAVLEFLGWAWVCVGCAPENTDSPLNKRHHRGHSELRALFTLHWPRYLPGTAPCLSVNGTHRHMDEDTEQAYHSQRHVPGGLPRVTTTWAVAIVRCLYRGTEEPSRMLFLSTQKKENYS